MCIVCAGVCACMCVSVCVCVCVCVCGLLLFGRGVGVERFEAIYQTDYNERVHTSKVDRRIKLSLTLASYMSKQSGAGEI